MSGGGALGSLRCGSAPRLLLPAFILALQTVIWKASRLRVAVKATLGALLSARIRARAQLGFLFSQVPETFDQ